MIRRLTYNLQVGAWTYVLRRARPGQLIWRTGAAGIALSRHWLNWHNLQTFLRKGGAVGRPRAPKGRWRTSTDSVYGYYDARERG